MRLVGRPLPAALVVVVALISGTVDPAMAGRDAVAERVGEAKVTFKSYGDRFVVCDLYPNNHDALNEYWYTRIDGSVQHEIEVAADYTCKTFDHNFGEGRSVRFRACWDGWIDQCSTYSVGIA